MAEVSPFRGWRYNPEMVGDIASVLCPPYDMISAQDQEALKRQHRHNVVHLEAGEGLDWSALVQGQYNRTASLFEDWMRDNVLLQDQSPAYYLMRHKFSLDGVQRSRLGLIACVGLADYQERQVLPHEFTEAPAIRDRVSLMESLRANVSPIMALYRDSGGELDPIFQKAMANTPDVESSDDFGSATTLWGIASPGDQDVIRSFFRDRPVYLADGHHRYEAARQYQLDRHAEDPAASAAGLAHNYVMMTLIAFDDPGLVVLPYHRSLRGLAPPQLDRVLERLNEVFQERPRERPMDAASPAGIVTEVERVGREQRVMATIGPADAGARLLTLRDEAADADWGPLAVSEAWVLEEKVLRPELGDATLEHLGFLHDHDEAAQGVADGRLQMAFLMKPFPLGVFEDIVGDGHRLPRKSTFFYPKLPTGLVINRLVGEL